MVGLVTLLGFIAMLIGIMLYYKKVNIVKALMISVFLYFSEFVVVSGFFFWIDLFKFKFVLPVILIINSIIIVLLRKNYKDIHIDYNIKQYIVPLLIICCIIPVTASKFELHGMGQDEGVYQIKAIALMTGNSKRQLDFAEYEKLNDENLKEEYRYIVKNRLAGFDNYDWEKPTLSKDNELSDVSGIFHGIPTFPALLALWGKIFGMKNMQGIQSIFLFLSILFVWFIGENLKLKVQSKLLSTLIFAISPVVLWVSKSSLSEMFLALIVCSWIYYLTEEKDKNSVYFSALSIVIFSFYHVTIYTMMPIIIGVYIIRYLFTTDKKEILSGQFAIIGFMMGYTMMMFTSPTYTSNNTRKPIEKFLPMITDSMLLPIIYIVSIFTIIVLFLLYILYNKKLIYISKKKLEKYLPKINVTLIILIVIKIVKSAISYGKENNSMLIALKNINIMGYVWASGILLIPIILYFITFKINNILWEKQKCVLYVMFLYCILIYSAVLRTDLKYYYYYSRYLIPYIPIITLLCSIFINNINKKIIYILCVVIACIYMPFNYVLSNQLDDTRMRWEILNEITEDITDKDIVLIEDGSDEFRSIIQTLALPIKYITGADVYFVFQGKEKLINDLLSQGNKIYYVTDKEKVDENIFGIKYKNCVHVSDDYQAFHTSLIPYPLEFSKTDYNIHVYKSTLELKYNIQDDSKDIISEGFGTVENDFMWSYNRETNIVCKVHKDDYTLKLKLGPGSLIDINLGLKVNGVHIGTKSIKSGSNNIEVKYDIPKEILNEGENNITLESNLWSPKDFGSEDSRNLGFSLRELEFVKK